MTAQLTDARASRRSGGVPLADSVVAQVLVDFATGDVSILEASRKHGISESTVSGIVTGKTHLHVPGPRLPPERIAELGAQHRAAAMARRPSGKRGICPGCGREGHPITKCPEPRG